MSEKDTTVSTRGSDLLAIGFGATVAMWALLYVCLMPGIGVPGDVVMGLMAVVLIAAGFVLGRRAGRSWRGGIGLGVIVTLVNLLVVTSLLGGDQPGVVREDAWVWLGGFAGFAIVTCTVATLIGRSTRKTQDDAHQGNAWHAAFPVVAICTTAGLIVAGGVVTGLEAGLAVPDWPNTFGHPMVFYPLSLMQKDGGVYAEHAHRLWGMLVGLTTIVLMIQTWRTDQRTWLRVLVVLVFLAVCLQGFIGGKRVYDKSVQLAMVHGVFAQVIFATLFVIAVACTRTWRNAAAAADTGQPAARSSASTERTIGITLVVLVFLQLVLGAVVRHFNHDHALLLHIALATAVFILAVIAAMRLIGMHGNAHPALKRIGIAVLGIVTLQVALGFGALIVTGMSAKAVEGDTSAVLADVIVTTAHQANGALLLGAATAMTLLASRLLGGGKNPQLGVSPNDQNTTALNSQSTETA